MVELGGSMTRREIEEMLKEADKAGDGLVDIEGKLRAIQKLAGVNHSPGGLLGLVSSS